MSDETGHCTAEVINNMLAVLQSACNGRDQNKMDRVRTSVDQLALVTAMEVYPGQPSKKYTLSYFALDVINMGTHSGAQLAVPGVDVSIVSVTGTQPVSKQGVRVCARVFSALQESIVRVSVNECVYCMPAGSQNPPFSLSPTPTRYVA